VYAGRADDLSVRATLPQLDVRQRSLMAAVRAVMPSSSSTTPVFGTVRGGMGRLAGAVADATGASFVLERLVRRIERTPRRFRVVHGPTVDERVLDADAVVVAVPAAAATRLLTDLAPAAAADLGSIDYASVALVTTAWRRRDAPPVHGSGYLVPAVSGRPVKAATFSSAKWAHLDTGDVVVARCSFGRHGESRDLQRDDEELVRLTAQELRSTAGFSGEPVEARVTRWGGGLPQYAVGHVDRVRRIRAAVADVPRLAVCGAAYDGVGIPACIRTGRGAAVQILEGLQAISASRDDR
jgi:oxygen-dependent protoporphyrinogen oxidase